MILPIIDYGKCIGCEACVDICNNEIFESYIFNERIMVEVDRNGFCAQCYDCQLYCEQDAIDFLE